VKAIPELASVRPKRGTLLTVGVFDGVHLGHKHLIDRLTQQAHKRNLLSGVVTFSSHPRAVLSTRTRLERLTTLEEKNQLLRDLGVDFIVALTFDNELAALSAREFVILLIRHLNMQGLVIGPNFAMGRGREGNVAWLQDLGKEIGFTVEIVKPIALEGSMVSSTAIRKALKEGDMNMTSKLLGRNFRLSGRVIGGLERGHTLGFPTANIGVDTEHALPRDGVYATLGRLGDKVYKSVTNIGMRPTFGEGERTIEVFLMDFDGDIYGKNLTIELVERLRGETKFASAEDLSAQIVKDVEQAERILG
jgi:riboflavin kinase/FMN adenylyltransferase